MQGKIRWDGYFHNMRDEYGARMKGRLEDFLTKANLVCDGMCVVAYDYDSAWSGSEDKVFLVEVPTHSNHADFVIIGVDLLDTALRVRVMWLCNNTFPAEMGIPTWKRLRKAVDQYNATGEIKTIMDDIARIPSAGDSLALGIHAILRGGTVTPQPC